MEWVIERKLQMGRDSIPQRFRENVLICRRSWNLSCWDFFFAFLVENIFNAAVGWKMMSVLLETSFVIWRTFRVVRVLGCLLKRLSCRDLRFEADSTGRGQYSGFTPAKIKPGRK
jgi:hypothetical protein